MKERHAKPHQQRGMVEKQHGQVHTLFNLSRSKKSNLIRASVQLVNATLLTHS